MSVTIQCPNGRRQTMKVNPNTTLLEILENVCQKLNLNPNQCELSRNNKPLDLSLTIRFANIPNNGLIDLKESSVVRKDQKVTIAMDSEDGLRQIKEFDPNQYLWDVIHTMFQNKPILDLEPNFEFVVIYVQKEIVGEKQLKETNLRGLGLIQGRAAMKLLVRPVNAPKEQAFVESLDLRKSSKEEKETKKNIEMKSNQSLPEVKIEPTATTSQQTSQEVTNSTLKETETTVEINSNENESKAQQIETEKTNEKLNQPIEQNSDDVQLMEISDQSEDESEEILNYLGGHNSEIIFKMSDLPKVSKKEFPDSFYETTKDDLMHVLTGLRQQQSVFGVIFSILMTFNYLRSGNRLKPLETTQMREQKRKQQIIKYESTVIRVCFPSDGLVLQAIFNPSDTVEDIKRVISRYIYTVDFYLYTVPPKRILKSDSTLLASELVPAAVIHFGINSSDSNQKVIKDEFKSKLSSYKSAAKIAAQTRSKSSTHNTSDTTHNTSGTTHNTSDTTQQLSQTSTKNMRTANEVKTCDQRESKVPKWFKTNK